MYKASVWTVRLALLGGFGVTACMHFGSAHWAMDLLSHFPMHCVGGFLTLVVLFSLFQRKLETGLAFGGALINVAAVAPFYLDPSRQVPPGEPTVRMVLSNVLLDNQTRQPLIDWILKEQPDVVALMEVSEDWTAAMDAHLQEWPFRLLRPQADYFGLALYSKFPLSDPRWVHLAGHAPLTLIASLKWKGSQIPLILTHPYQPLGRWASTTRNLQIQELIELPQIQSPLCILMGDLNATPWSHAFRMVEDSGLFNARKGFGVLPTWDASRHPVFRIPIDHVLLGEQWAVQDLRLGPDIGGDHLPLVIDLGRIPITSL